MNVPTMTVKEIAESFQCAESSIKRAIEKVRPILGEVLINNQGGYLLNELQVTAIKLELEKHHNLGNNSELPKTKLEKTLLIKQALELLIDDVNTLKAENEILKPKAIEYDRFIDNRSNQLIRDVAKTLGFPPLKLYSLLRARHVLNDNNVAYQKYIDLDYFIVREKPTANGFNVLTTYVTSKGVDWISKMLKSSHIQIGV